MKIVSFLIAVLLTATAVAQNTTDATLQEPRVTAEARMKELRELEQKLIADWRKAVEEAKEAAESADPDAVVPALMMRPDFGPLVVKAREFAAEFAGTDDAVPFLIHALQNSEEAAQRRELLDTLLASHIDSPKLAELGGMFGYLEHLVTPEYAEQALVKLSNSADPAVRGWARLATTQHVIEKADREGEEYRAAKEALLKIAAEAGDENLASEIRGLIDLREKFGPGNLAPDIVGVDLDGVAFKLSDYKGKVVFLDFWGNW